MNLFLVKVKNYDDRTNTEKEEAALVFGENFTEAANKIERDFDNITDITIKEVCYDCSANILYLPKEYEDFISGLINANDY